MPFFASCESGATFGSSNGWDVDTRHQVSTARSKVNWLFGVQLVQFLQPTSPRTGWRNPNRNSMLPLHDFYRMNSSNYRWIYAKFIGIDANFRLKRMNVSSDERDPGLNKGYAYVVEEIKYKKYLAEYDTKIPLNEKSTCHNHDAIKSASMRGGKGTAATGLATAECSRHDMKCPTAVGDLQKGERCTFLPFSLVRC